MSFCPIPHTFRDQVWLSVGLGLGLGFAQILRRSLRRRLLGATKLYYWPATGKAETIRMLLAEMGVAFEEVNFDKPDSVQQIYVKGGEGMKATRTSAAATAFFAACRAKGGNSTTNTPMLEVDGRCYTQSTAIYKLVARRGGLYPSDDAEASYIVDSVMAHCEDAFPLCYQALRGQVSREELADTLVPKRTPRAPRSHTPTPTASSAEPFSLDGPRGNRNLPSADTTLSVRAQTSATWSGCSGCTAACGSPVPFRSPTCASPTFASTCADVAWKGRPGPSEAAPSARLLGFKGPCRSHARPGATGKLRRHPQPASARSKVQVVPLPNTLQVRGLAARLPRALPAAQRARGESQGAAADRRVPHERALRPHGQVRPVVRSAACKPPTWQALPARSPRPHPSRHGRTDPWPLRSIEHCCCCKLW